MIRHKMHCRWWGWSGRETKCKRPPGFWASVIEQDAFEDLAAIPEARKLLCQQCLKALGLDKEASDD